ncbi:MAG: hypothetical protein RBT63_06275, partial [Bdellovibrionales bacterium]|nr:hypothetical protein [Bdellovibrionales bacterium]
AHSKLFEPTKGQELFACFNLASHGVSNVKFLAETVAKAVAQVKGLSASPRIEYGDGNRGWVGDVSYTWLDGSKLESLGWSAQLASNQAVERAVLQIVEEKARAL